jgi:hypothetical protein
MDEFIMKTTLGMLLLLSFGVLGSGCAAASADAETSASSDARMRVTPDLVHAPLGQSLDCSRANASDHACAWVSLDQATQVSTEAFRLRCPPGETVFCGDTDVHGRPICGCEDASAKVATHSVDALLHCPKGEVPYCGDTDPRGRPICDCESPSEGAKARVSSNALIRCPKGTFPSCTDTDAHGHPICSCE